MGYKFLSNKHKVVKVVYLAKFKNILYNIGDQGLFLLTRIFHRKPSKNKNKTDLFSSFHKIVVSNRRLYVPSDLSTQSPDTNEELLLAIFNNNTKFLLEYDYSNYEDKSQKIQDTLDEYMKLLAKKSHNPEYLTEKDRLTAEYCKYKPNRHYNDKFTDITLKRPDEIDGHYIDNGYR